MFLHVGADIVIPVGDIIAILDWEKMKKAKNKKAVMKSYLGKTEIIDVSNGRPKSLVCLQVKIAYISPVSTGTLRKRGTDIFALGGLC